MTLSIVTPEKVVFSGEIDQLTVPTTDGHITILPHHEALVSLLGYGEVAVVSQGERRHMAVHGGVVTVQANEIQLLTDAAELEEDVDERRAAAALEQARLSKEQAQTDVAEADALAAMERALARLRIAERRKHRHQA